ncbi:GtrA family protein [Demequina aurantiaca]|uniref:GtrA family protein n=1 Tax=Demequina aurantiaca TaxID=676200 RepID=UPI000A032BA0|nr:GtrA family protein [Demequina aurantiaca]
MGTTYRRLGSDIVSIGTWVRGRAGELAKFGTVGVAGIFVDAGVFNLLLLGPLAVENKVITAKIIASVVSTIFAWAAHRWWTFNDRRGHRPVRELVIFALVNGAALAAQAGVLAISHYWLGLTGALADNFFAYGIGLPLGTVLRYVGYRAFVFNHDTTSAADAVAGLGAVDADVTSPDGDDSSAPPAHA